MNWADGELMISVLAVAAAVLMVTFTLKIVVGRVLKTRRRMKSLGEVRDVVDAIAREVMAGGRSLDAVERASEGLKTEALRRALDVECARVRLGAAPGAGSVGAGAGAGAAAGAAGPVNAESSDAPSLLSHLFQIWGISHRHGVGLAGLARAHVTDIDAQLAHISKSTSATAGARLTVTVLLALPVGAVALGQASGLGTLNFLITNVLGVLLFLAGVGLVCAGTLWTEYLSESLTTSPLGGVGVRAGPATPTPMGPLDAARALDVTAAALHAGKALLPAWELGVGQLARGNRSEASEGQDLLQHSLALLYLGGGEQAWLALADHPLFGPIARQAAQQTRAGTSLADGMRQQAEHLRRVAADKATAGAEKVLIALAAPLTLCFLPAFVFVGLIPLAIGMASL
ncbi:type II secretion system F family protein [Corynebacterium sp. HMSC058E07]|uniref:type II secretion system F family protein n=1 Tax=Corynebacterium sp. HMSC058E07 TaxID=1715157 RepID=UPI001FF05A64|nr:type II secretion system F family protein [Corynebacterium sp. HMSC058E07]